jgi:hypothetical protein
MHNHTIFYLNALFLYLKVNQILELILKKWFFWFMQSIYYALANFNENQTIDI